MPLQKDRLIQVFDRYDPLINIISIAEAAAQSNLSSRHMRFLLEQGKIYGKKIGRDWITTKEAVDEYLNLGLKPGPKPSKND
jgi:excisionase family DNA binding protein